MADDIEIPFKLDDARRAALVMQDVVDSFGALEREVLKVAKADEKAATAFTKLEEGLAKGTISAEKLRAELAKIAAQAPTSLGAVANAAKEQERALAKARSEAEKNRRETHQAFEEASRRRAEATAANREHLSSAADRFNETREAVRSVIEGIHGAARAITSYAGEAQQLQRAQDSLGLSFEEAQGHAGRFVSTIDLMRFSTYAANRGLRLSQEELNAFGRIGVAQAAARGKEVSEVFENMVDGIIEGDESLEKLDGRFKRLAGDTHTAGERIRALVSFAREVRPAADDAASSFARFEESVRNSARTASLAFTTEIARLDQIASGTGRAADATTDWNEKLRAIGATVAFVTEFVGRGIAMVVSFVAGAMVAIGNLGNAARAAVAGGGRHVMEQIASGSFDFSGVGREAATAFGSNMRDAAGGALGFANDQLTGLRALINDDNRTSATAEQFTLADARRRRAEERRNQTTRTRNNTPQSQVEQAAIEALTRRIDAERRAMSEARDGLAHANALEEHGLDVARARARTEFERAQVEQDARRVQMEGLESSQELERSQLQNLRGTREQLEAEREHLGSVKMRNAYADRIRGLHEDEVRVTRELEDRERAMARLAAESARAEEQRAEALKEAQYAARDVAQERAREIEASRRRFQTERDADYDGRQNGTRIREHFREQANAAVDTASVVISAYDQMTQAASAHFEALVTGQETAGEALQGFVSDTLKAFAKIAAQQAIFELGKGFAALFLNPAEAAAHFGAAALFGVVAAGAGAAAQAVAPGEKSRGSAGGAASRDREAANVNSRSSSQGGTTQINVMFGGPVYGSGGVRQAGRELAGVLNRGAVQGGTLLNPLLIPAGG